MHFYYIKKIENKKLSKEVSEEPHHHFNSDVHDSISPCI